MRPINLSSPCFCNHLQEKECKEHKAKAERKEEVISDLDHGKLWFFFIFGGHFRALHARFRAPPELVQSQGAGAEKEEG
jgi:hypothetical protein